MNVVKDHPKRTKRTSFVYHQIFAVLSILLTIILLISMYTKYFNKYQYFILTILIVGLWGIHAIIHYLDEYFFGFDPLF